MPPRITEVMKVGASKRTGIRRFPWRFERSSRAGDGLRCADLPSSSCSSRTSPSTAVSIDGHGPLEEKRNLVSSIVVLSGRRVARRSIRRANLDSRLQETAQLHRARRQP